MRDTDLFQLALGLVPPWRSRRARSMSRQSGLISRSTSFAVAVSHAPNAPRSIVPCTTPRCRSGGISTSSSIRRSCTPGRRASPALIAA